MKEGKKERQLQICPCGWKKVQGEEGIAHCTFHRESIG